MGQQLEDMFDDDNYPAYTMGQAAELVGVSQDFLRSLETRLLNPHRSEGGHRRYSRYQLRLAARTRALVDEGTAIDAACRIIVLEDQLAEAQRLNRQYQQDTDQPKPLSHGGSDDETGPRAGA
ncbi:hypothetical protein Athai_14550 [Actinocatenispora thailandica]|uniref:HTH merR-type domain-containing protein n=1 Tax=Actinocatenispora thailandica TaxID=227318 RepID=A0A7R7HVA0_9ACTN|nr:helix-turn-helix domain-containing protein [Actinocatenispora thailandica]BCJ33952.1 hypothetical protein Athai_14550 [Actinocatenispora thailandica]